ncbi:MAG: glycosyltransferase family 2 protein [Acidimicrobiales bacterium]
MEARSANDEVAGSRPDVTVVVIAHDVVDLLRQCLQSVRNAAGGIAVETIVVDNGSTDGTAQMVTASFPEVRLIRRPGNEGVPGRNHGLRAARGRHRMFLDSDAELTEGALPALVAALDASPDVGLVGPRLVYPDGGLQLSTRRFPPLLLPLYRFPPFAARFESGTTMRRHLMADDPHDRRRPVEYVLGACQLFRADAQAAAGEIDRRIWFGHDDADWCFRIRQAGYQVVYVPEAEVVHHYQRRAAAHPLSLFTLRFLLAHVYFQLKWMTRRRHLVNEGAAMDRRAAAARGR